MRLSTEQIEVIAFRVINDLRRDGLISTAEPADAQATVEAVITEELRVEDRLNDEVREIMRSHDAQIRRADVQSHELFRAIKAKLARERDIIL